MLAQGTNPQHVLLNWCYVYLDKLIRQTVDDDIVGLQPALLPPLLGQHSLNGKMDAKCNQFWIEPRHVRQLSATTSDPDTHIFNFNHLLYTAKRANRHILQCVYVCVCVCVCERVCECVCIVEVRAKTCTHPSCRTSWLPSPIEGGAR